MADEVAVASVKIEGIETFSNVEVLDVEDSDRLIDKATVVFDDTYGIAAATMLEQRNVVIELGWSSEQARVFEGIVWRVKTEARGDGSGSKQRVTLVALDLSYKLNQGEGKAKVHPPGKLSDILKRIVAPYQIPVGQIKLAQDPEFKPEAPLTQGPKTDWAFIQELAVRYGARAFVEVNGDKSQFYFVSEKFFLDGDPVGQMTYVHGTSPWRAGRPPCGRPA
jgi:phage protein D